MKSHKLIILSLVIFSFFYSCSTTDYEYDSVYIYKNESTSSVTVKSSYKKYSNNGLIDRDSIFVIPINGEHKLTFYTEGGFLPPFYWGDYPRLSDSIIVSNGSKDVIYRFKDNAAIYDIEESYELVTLKKYVRIYQYKFTDSDFE